MVVDNTFPLSFGALSAALWTGDMPKEPNHYLIDPEKRYPVTLFAKVLKVVDPNVVCRVSGGPGAYQVTPNFEIRWSDPRFYGDWALSADGAAELEAVILVLDE